MSNEMNPLQKIINGLGEAALMETPINVDNEAMGRYMMERSKPIVYPPYTLHKFRNKKDEESEPLA
ncbi:hypothetical protein [Peribacillus muralis]|uniref:hypothetical protein n=1 Tax=Peribacillus muralis TaxID=264697 RepID=UPI00070A4066|nr:hypothetical protein [Peribacillus muralis]